VSFVDLVGSFKNSQAPDRANLDREWRNCKRFEISSVRGHIRRPDAPPAEMQPVAQVELTAIITTVGKLDGETSGNLTNWGIVAQQLCPDLESPIEDAIQECWRVTERELLEIFTISENL
jgi:hypothetical protein